MIYAFDLTKKNCPKQIEIRSFFFFFLRLMWCLLKWNVIENINVTLRVLSSSNFKISHFFTRKYGVQFPFPLYFKILHFKSHGYF